MTAYTTISKLDVKNNKNLLNLGAAPFPYSVVAKLDAGQLPGKADFNINNKNEQCYYISEIEGKRVEKMTNKYSYFEHNEGYTFTTVSSANTQGNTPPDVVCVNVSSDETRFIVLSPGGVPGEVVTDKSGKNTCYYTEETSVKNSENWDWIVCKQA